VAVRAPHGIRQLNGRPKRFDTNLIVIGAGSAGLISALIAATVKAKVTLIERNTMGGDCLNTGCVPSKTLIRSAKVAHYLKDAHRYGLRNVSGTVDFAAVMQRVRDAIATIAPNDSVERYTALGVDCIMGEARIVDPWTVAVDGRRITAPNIVVATGGTPFIPPIPGIGDVGVLTSDDVWSLNELPQRLLIMGAGPIGCELAQSFERLGSRVTLIDMAARILPKDDADAAALVADALRDEGVDVRVACKAERFDAARRVLIADERGAKVEIAYDRVLVAVGRRAHTESLGLDAIGVAVNRDGTIGVDDYLRSSVANILACGDVVGPYQFTHMASHQAWYAAVNALFGRVRKFKVNYSVVPWATYTDPEVARVGLTDEEARARGVDVEVTRHDLDHVDRAIADGDTRGFIKVLTKRGSDRVVGATIVAPQAGELIAEYVLAMTHGLGLRKMMGTIHVYPTNSEINKFAATGWRRNHSPSGLLKFAERYHALWR
jgi:pyruvate/2-oxoglutarate dehydrogenase complex dihydrolipoamide dehydrogenase (E3) component